MERDIFCLSALPAWQGGVLLCVPTTEPRTVFMVDDQKRKLFRTELRPTRTTNRHDDDDGAYSLTLFHPFLCASVLHVSSVSHNRSYLVLASTTNGLKSCNGRGGTSLASLRCQLRD